MKRKRFALVIIIAALLSSSPTFASDRHDAIWESMKTLAEIAGTQNADIKIITESLLNQSARISDLERRVMLLEKNQNIPDLNVKGY